MWFMKPGMKAINRVEASVGFAHETGSNKAPVTQSCTLLMHSKVCLPQKPMATVNAKNQAWPCCQPQLSPSVATSSLMMNHYADNSGILSNYLRGSSNIVSPNDTNIWALFIRGEPHQTFHLDYHLSTSCFAYVQQSQNKSELKKQTKNVRKDFKVVLHSHTVTTPKCFCFAKCSHTNNKIPLHPKRSTYGSFCCNTSVSFCVSKGSGCLRFSDLPPTTPALTKVSSWNMHPHSIGWDSKSTHRAEWTVSLLCHFQQSDTLHPSSRLFAAAQCLIYGAI